MVEEFLACANFSRYNSGMDSSIDLVRKTLREKSDPLRAAHSARFFKLEPGDHDEFLGVIVPDQRKISREYYRKLSPEDTVGLLQSVTHEERLTALLIWVLQYQKGDEAVKKEVYNLYLKNTKWINNWDLVDSSASYIVGDYIFDKDRKILDKLSRSNNIWERRIAILAAGEFIKRGEFGPTLDLAEQNLGDSHHYIHKATGWMLREVGKRDESVLRDFLDAHAAKMPRTMLRYAIERLSQNYRQRYLKMI